MSFNAPAGSGTMVLKGLSNCLSPTPWETPIELPARVRPGRESFWVKTQPTWSPFNTFNLSDYSQTCHLDRRDDLEVKPSERSPPHDH